MIDQQLREVSAAEGAPKYKADWDIWGANTQRIRMLMMAFRDVDKHLICTAQATDDTEGATGIKFKRPALTPALAKAVVGMFDIVGYLRITAKGDRVLRVHPTKTVQAKSRFALPEEITNPSWNLITKEN